MRIVTWNVNSLKARMPRVVEWIEFMSPDVLCMQETKLADDSFPTEVFQNMVEPPPPPPPQAPAPHPYVKVDNNNKKNNANNGDNIKVHSEQPQYQPENQAKKVFELYEEQEEEQRELQETK